MVAIFRSEVINPNTGNKLGWTSSEDIIRYALLEGKCSSVSIAEDLTLSESADDQDRQYGYKEDFTIQKEAKIVCRWSDQCTVEISLVEGGEGDLIRDGFIDGKVKFYINGLVVKTDISNDVSLSTEPERWQKAIDAGRMFTFGDFTFEDDE